MAKKEAVKDSGTSTKNPALESALAQIQKQFGKDAIMKMGDGSQQGIEAISSGSLGLDIALGIGGYPRRFGAYFKAGEPCLRTACSRSSVLQ